MILFAFNIALAATLTATAGLITERICSRRAVALRHALLLVCMLVVAAVPLLASVAHAAGIGLLQTLPPPAPGVVTLSQPPAGDAPVPVTVHAPPIAQAPVLNERLSPYSVKAAHWAAAALPCGAEFLIAVWALGTSYQLLRFIRSFTRTGHLSGVAERVGEDVRRLASASARRVGLHTLPQVAWCALAPSPLVMGLFHPRVLLPRSAAALSVDELEAVLLHELAHVARRDQWAGLLASLVRAAFWWCLPVDMLIGRLGDLREQLCDAQVVGCQGHGLNLATALLRVCEWSMRGRPAYLAPALGAAGSSSRALRNRIQSLIQKENTPMFHLSLRARLAVGAAGLLIAAAVMVANVRVTDASPQRLAAGVRPSALLLVSAADFWKNAGTAKHKLDGDTITELQKLVDKAARPEYRLRAAKLLCDQDGHSRLNQNLSGADNDAVVVAAFEYLEAHLADPEVAKFAPQRGFTDMTLSEMAGDQPGNIWVLIEIAGAPRTYAGGLNIKVDVKAAKVTDIHRWGDVRPAEKAK